jgi:hypothetical protein
LRCERSPTIETHSDKEAIKAVGEGQPDGTTGSGGDVAEDGVVIGGGMDAEGAGAGAVRGTQGGQDCETVDGLDDNGVIDADDDDHDNGDG